MFFLSLSFDQITKLKEGKSYTVRVSAKNEAGLSQPREKNFTAKDLVRFKTNTVVYLIFTSGRKSFGGYSDYVSDLTY